MQAAGPGVSLSSSHSFRILMIAACPFPAPQGSQVFIGGLAAALARTGAEVWLLTYPGGVGLASKGVVHLTCAGIGRPVRIRAGPWAGKLLFYPKLRDAARHAINALRPEVIHAHNIEALQIAAPLARAAGVPVIYGQHGQLAHELPTYFRFALPRRLLRRLGERLDRKAEWLADGFDVLSDAAARSLVKSGVAADRVHAGPPGIDLEAFHRTEARMPTGVATGNSHPLVVYGGNLDGYQNLETLRRAFNRLHRWWPSARLILASHEESGPYGQVRRRWAREPGTQFVRVASFGEMKALLLAADILVNPRSTPGGFPVKLLNYMAAGKPIVSCHGPGAFLENGREALLVDDGDPEAFASALARLTSEDGLRDRLGRGARQRLAKGFAWDSRAKELLEFYRRLIARPHAEV